MRDRKQNCRSSRDFPENLRPCGLLSHRDGPDEMALALFREPMIEGQDRVRVLLGVVANDDEDSNSAAGC